MCRGTPRARRRRGARRPPVNVFSVCFAHASPFACPALAPQPQLVSLHGYPSESHVVVTEDGYLLTLHRIPGGRNHRGPSGGAAARPVVFLQHGLLASSADWVLTGPGKSLGR